MILVTPFFFFFFLAINLVHEYLWRDVEFNRNSGGLIVSLLQLDGSKIGLHKSFGVIAFIFCL